MPRHLITRLSIVLFSLTLGACARFSEHSTGLSNGSLIDCPAWPRCVSSLAADANKLVQPLFLNAPLERSWDNLIAVVGQTARTRLVRRSDHYLHAEVISPWGWYTDDLELLLDPQSGRVDVRSSGRIGYYDFDVNLDRVEALRTALQKQGLLKSTF